MNPATVIQLAATRGIDLSHVGGAASDLKGQARKRTRTADERKQGISNVPVTAAGRETRNYRPPAFTLAKLGQAAAGLGPIPWNAALYSFAGCEDGYWLLWGALSFQACRLARCDHWTPRVLTRDGSYRFYRDQLTELVLLEDANKQLFAERPNLCADWLNVEPVEWDRHLEGPYRWLRDVYGGWLRIAQAAIGRRISEQ